MSRRSRDTLTTTPIGCVGHDCAACRAKEAKSALTRAEATTLRSAALLLVDWANNLKDEPKAEAWAEKHRKVARRIREIANRYAPPKNATKKVGALSSQGEEV
jgi:hypothetical protein